MRFRYGCVGTILGAMVGVAATILILSATNIDNDLAIGFGLVLFGPAGLLIGALLGIIVALLALRYEQSKQAETSVPPRKIPLVKYLVIGAPLLAAVLLWEAVNVRNAPSDNQFLQNFEHCRPALEQLVQMIQTDKGLERVDDNWTLPHKPEVIGVPETRIAQYRRLMNGIGMKRGFRATPDASEIDFYCWLTGSAISSDYTKGYAYLAKPPAHLSRSLDSNPPHAGTTYRHIQGNWYLFYEYVPETSE